MDVKPKSSGIPGPHSEGLTVYNQISEPDKCILGNKVVLSEIQPNLPDDAFQKNITHSGNTRLGNRKYNRKMGSFPDRNLLSSLPIPPMLKQTTSTSRNVCHPSPVVRGGGYAGRAGWFRSWAAVLLVSI
jgi:hypothetical protein